MRCNLFSKANLCWRFLSITASLKIFNIAYVRSKLEYCSIVWSPNYSVHINSVERVQRKFTIFGYFAVFRQISDNSVSYDDWKIIFGLDLHEDGRLILQMQFLHQIIHGTLDSPDSLQKNIFSHHALWRWIVAHKSFHQQLICVSHITKSVLTLTFLIVIRNNFKVNCSNIFHHFEFVYIFGICFLKSRYII